MTSKLVTTLAAVVFAGGLASAARAADTGPGVPPPPAAQGPATMGNDAMMGSAGKPGPQDHGMAAGGQMGGGMMPMPDMMAMMAMMNNQKSDAPDLERMGTMLQTNMMLEMNMMMQLNMMRMMNTMMGEMRHGGGHHGMMDGAGKAPPASATPQGAVPPG